jgi:hypothetical protein
MSELLERKNAAGRAGDASIHDSQLSFQFSSILFFQIYAPHSRESAEGAVGADYAMAGNSQRQGVFGHYAADCRTDVIHMK